MGEPVRKEEVPYKDHLKELPRLVQERCLPFEPLYNLVVKSDDVPGISRGHVLKVLGLLHEEGWTLTHSPSPSGTNGTTVPVDGKRSLEAQYG